MRRRVPGRKFDGFLILLASWECSSEVDFSKLEFTLTEYNLSGLVKSITFFSQSRHGDFGIRSLVCR
jgi:hypothetical protein